MTPNVPTSESGTATPGMSVARERAEEEEDDHHDQPDGEHQLELHVVRPRRGWSSCGRSGP